MAVKVPRFVSVSVLVAVLLLGGGLYFLSLVLAPHIDTWIPPDNWNTPVQHAPKARLTADRLYLPKLKLNLPYKSGDQSVLNDAVWHRYPERGNPKNGGNFILAGHRFELGLTPGETRRKSPFYRLDHIQPGDAVFIDYEGVRYQYKVTRRFIVRPNDIYIEARSSAPKMTLYSCTFGGTWDGREVVEAKLIEKNIDPSRRF